MVVRYCFNGMRAGAFVTEPAVISNFDLQHGQVAVIADLSKITAQVSFGKLVHNRS